MNRTAGQKQTEKEAKKHCSHCYENGAFTQPDLTAEQMKERVKEKLVEFTIPKFLTGFFTRNIPKLERWTK